MYTNPSQLKRRRRDLLKMVHFTWSQKRSKSMSINRNKCQVEKNKEEENDRNSDQRIRHSKTFVTHISTLIHITLAYYTHFSSHGSYPIRFPLLSAVCFSVDEGHDVLLLVRYKKDIMNLRPHHFRERSDLSCFQLNLLLNR